MRKCNKCGEEREQINEKGRCKACVERSRNRVANALRPGLVVLSLVASIVARRRIKIKTKL